MRCFAAADFFSSISSTKRWKKRKSVESKVRSGTLSPRGSQSGRIALPAEKCSVSTAKEDSEETLEGEKRQKAKDAEKSASTASASAASLNGDFEVDDDDDDENDSPQLRITADSNACPKHRQFCHPCFCRAGLTL